MRNRVARRGTHAARAWAVRVARAVLALVALPAIVLVATAGGAAAQETAQARVPFSVAGPVGLATVALGLGGLAWGLIRLRRKSAAAAEVPPVDPAAVPPVSLAAGAQQTPVG